MKKVKVIRQSGLPVNLENLDSYREDWKVEYDRVFQLHKSDFDTLNKELDELEKVLLKKWKAVEEWEWITSKKQWVKLTKSYGPIAIATSEQNELIYVIMDKI